MLKASVWAALAERERRRFGRACQSPGGIPRLSATDQADPRASEQLTRVYLRSVKDSRLQDCYTELGLSRKVCRPSAAQASEARANATSTIALRVPLAMLYISWTSSPLQSTIASHLPTKLALPVKKHHLPLETRQRHAANFLPLQHVIQRTLLQALQPEPHNTLVSHPQLRRLQQHNIPRPYQMYPHDILQPASPAAQQPPRRESSRA